MSRGRGLWQFWALCCGWGRLRGKADDEQAAKQLRVSHTHCPRRRGRAAAPGRVAVPCSRKGSTVACSYPPLPCLPNFFLFCVKTQKSTKTRNVQHKISCNIHLRLKFRFLKESDEFNQNSLNFKFQFGENFQFELGQNRNSKITFDFSQ